MPLAWQIRYWRLITRWLELVALFPPSSILSVFQIKTIYSFLLCNTPAVTQMILGASYSISAPRLGNNTECKTTLHSVFPVQVVFQDFCLCVWRYVNASQCLYISDTVTCLCLTAEQVWIWCCFLYFILRKVFCYNFFLDFKKYHIYCLLHLGFFWSQCCKWCFQPYLYETYYKCLYMESYKHHNKAWICRSQTRLNTP